MNRHNIATLPPPGFRGMSTVDIKDDKVFLACFCGYRTSVKNNGNNIDQANHKAREAHKKGGTIVQHPSGPDPRRLSAEHANPIPTHQLFVSARDTAGSGTANGASMGIARMDVQRTTTTMQSVRGETTQTQQHGLAVNGSGKLRVLPDGTTEVEGAFQMSSKGSTTIKQEAEYMQRITQLEVQIQKVDLERVKAVQESRSAKSYAEAIQDNLSSQLVEALLNETPGVDTAVLLMAVPILLRMIKDNIPEDKMKSWLQRVPQSAADNPQWKRWAKQTFGDKYKDLSEMDDEECAGMLTRAYDAGLTLWWLQQLGIWPMGANKKNQKERPTLQGREKHYFYDDVAFETQYNGSVITEPERYWEDSRVLTKKIHWHLLRPNGERPTLVAIASDGIHEVATLPHRNYEIKTCFVAYECIWKHRCGQTFTCCIAEELLEACPEYAEKVLHYRMATD